MSRTSKICDHRTYRDHHGCQFQADLRGSCTNGTLRGSTRIRTAVKGNEGATGNKMTTITLLAISDIRLDPVTSYRPQPRDVHSAQYCEALALYTQPALYTASIMGTQLCNSLSAIIDDPFNTPHRKLPLSSQLSTHLARPVERSAPLVSGRDGRTSSNNSCICSTRISIWDSMTCICAVRSCTGGMTLGVLIPASCKVGM